MFIQYCISTASLGLILSYIVKETRMPQYLLDCNAKLIYLGRYLVRKIWRPRQSEVFNVIYCLFISFLSRAIKLTKIATM